MRLDHVSYACAPEQLAEVVQRIGSDLGAAFTDGGIHPTFGTRNFILPLSDATYIEVVAALDHPAADKAPFGQAVRRRAEQGGGWLCWVVAVDDISPVEARLGRASVPGHRVRPDGVELRWRQIGVQGVLEDPELPYFVQWDPRVEHPSGQGNEVRLASLEICGDPGTVRAWLDADDDELTGSSISWVDADEPGLMACTFLTPRGFVRID